MGAITEPAALVEGLEAVWRSIDDLCAGLDEEQWRAPTACPGWSVQDNLAHLIGIESMLLGREAAPAVEMPDYVRNPIGESNENEVVLRRSRTGAEVLA